MRQEKLLKPTTIIPPHLYVERAADRQLEQVVQDLGRPAYILVARQMGKTNLLINLKRARESAGDLVIYVDLSNRFSTARGLFRHIVDTILDSHPELLRETAKKIELEREKHQRQANSEYDRHIRDILRSVPDARLVVLLDEVDSLVNCSYSDTILAQIRSMYFSRVTYQEYGRFTYVLSGVAEPSELIKDKSISPFNIGEKIYLEDFSEAEFSAFVAKSNVGIPHEVAKRIFYWTSGNPRMSWDVTSAVEDRMLKSSAYVDADAVDEVVTDLYLTHFDRAPVDHIRDLVEADPTIRDALMSIRYGKTDTIDDRIRSKLYLAGIVSATSGKLALKCRIIDSALSEQWLRQVPSSDSRILQAASEALERRDYAHVVQLFRQYAAQPDAASLGMPSLFERGVASFHTGGFAQAVEDLSLVISDSDAAVDHQHARHLLGASLVRLRRAGEAITHLEISYDHSAGPARYSAGLTLSSAYLGADPKRYGAQAKEILSELIESGMAALEANASHEEMVATVRYNAAWACSALGDARQARQHIDVGLAETSAPYKPALYLLLRQSVTAQTSKVEAIENAARVIVENALNPVEGPVYGLAYSSRYLVSVLGELAELSARISFEKLIEDTVRRFSDRGSSRFLILTSFMSDTANAQEREERRPLLDWISHHAIDETVSKAERLGVLIELSTTGTPNARTIARQRFLAEFFRERGPEDLDQNNIIMLINELNFRIGSTPTSVESEILEYIWNNQDAIRADYPHLLALLFQQAVSIYSALGDFDRSEAAARKTLSIMDEVDFDELDEEWRSFGPSLRAHAENHLRFRSVARRGVAKATASTDPYKAIGRNTKVRVRDKQTFLTTVRKFKVVEDQVRSGALDLVEIVYD